MHRDQTYIVQNAPQHLACNAVQAGQLKLCPATTVVVEFDTKVFMHVRGP